MHTGRNQQKVIKGMECKVLLFIILAWIWLMTCYYTSAVFGQTELESLERELDSIFQSGSGGGAQVESTQELTDRDNDPDDNTVDSIDGPLKIQLELIQDNKFPENYVIQDYTFKFNGLTQQPRNYALQEGDDFSQVRLDSDSLLITGIGALEIENTTGTITETDILQVGGFIQIDKTIEDSATGEITHILDYGMVNIGDFDWMDVTGNITITESGAIVTLEDRPIRT